MVLNTALFHCPPSLNVYLTTRYMTLQRVLPTKPNCLYLTQFNDGRFENSTAFHARYYTWLLIFCSEAREREG